MCSRRTRGRKLPKRSATGAAKQRDRLASVWQVSEEDRNDKKAALVRKAISHGPAGGSIPSRRRTPPWHPGPPGGSTQLPAAVRSHAPFGQHVVHSGKRGAPAGPRAVVACAGGRPAGDRKGTRLNSSHSQISYAAFCLKKK